MINANGNTITMTGETKQIISEGVKVVAAIGELINRNAIPEKKIGCKMFVLQEMSKAMLDETAEGQGFMATVDTDTEEVSVEEFGLNDPEEKKEEKE